MTELARLLQILTLTAQTAHLDRSAATRLARVLVGEGATSVELGWWEDGEPPKLVIQGTAGGAPTPHEVLDHVIRTGRALLPAGKRERDLVVRLPIGVGAIGWLRIAGPAHLPLFDEALLESLVGVIALALSHCMVVARVAGLSRRAHEEGAELRRKLGDSEESIVGTSTAIREILSRASLVAPHGTTVLVTGESGTGKELIARRIHRVSERPGPFLAVNCGAIPDALVESELFGHEKGAFTGAHARHLGVFERAKGGTLFLDEVGDLPKAAQVKLLRALQERAIERVGGERPIAVDVRVIAATHRPLEKLVEKKKFREDLYYRLATFPIRVPPLRERLEDLPLLVARLLDEIGRRLGRALRVTPAVLARLAQHEWRGNVRELANVLERAAIVSPGEDLVLDELPRSLRPTSARPPETFDEAARRCIESALAASGGRLWGTGGAAERLGLRPTTLQGKMRRLAIASGKRKRAE